MYCMICLLCNRIHAADSGDITAVNANNNPQVVEARNKYVVQQTPLIES